MTDKEIKEVLGRGTPSTFSLDPNIKDGITRSTLEAINRAVKKHLASNKRVSVVVVKE
jgi:hypothetical protein